ncbi:MAG TPA: hypothetical protein VFC07_06860 [Verrucomicrobiae bacterium]|nr:hypothetical protein [Verrucomicrobiae bacterium]
MRLSSNHLPEPTSRYDKGEMQGACGVMVILDGFGRLSLLRVTDPRSTEFGLKAAQLAVPLASPLKRWRP